MAINLDAILKISAQVGGTDQVLKMKSALEQLGLEMDDTGKISNRYAESTKGATIQSGLFGAATVALGGFMLDAAYKAAEFAKESVAAGFALEQTETRLRMLSGSYGEYDQVQQIVAKNAQTLNVSQAAASNGFADIYARLRPLGTSLEDVNAVYLGFNSLAMQSGTTAEAASGAFMQLSQALGSGTLRGDEFNSVAEQVPGILLEVSKVMGQPVGSLRDLAAQGNITSDVVIQAMRNAASEGGAALEELANSAAAAPNRLSVEFQNLQSLIGQELVPALAPFMDGLTAIVETMQEWMVPATRMVAEGWAWFANVLKVEVFPILQPLVEKFGEVLGVANMSTVAETWQGMLVIGINAVVDAMEVLIPIAVDVLSAFQKMRDTMQWIISNTPFGWLAQQLGVVAKTAQEARGEMTEFGNTAAVSATATTEVAQGTATMAANTESATEAAKKLKEEQRQVKEEIRQSNALLDASNDQEQAKLGILEQEAQMRLDKAKTINEELDALKDIRDISLRQAQLDYDAARQKIQAQVDLGRMLQSEADVRLETLQIQYQQTQATINQTFETEKIKASEAAINAIKKDSLDVTVQTVAATRDLEDAVNDVTSAKTRQANVEKIAGPFIGSQTQVDLINAREAYNLEQLKIATQEQINDLLEKGTNAALQYAKALEISSAEYFKTAAAIANQPRGIAMPAFSTGGYVTRPTVGLIGEGGESEYVIPESKMAAASAGYLTGARGADVLNAPSVPSAQGSGSGGGGSAVVPDPKVNVMIQTGPVMQDKDGTWVTMEDFQRGVQEAMVTTTRQIYAALQQPTVRNSLAF